MRSHRAFAVQRQMSPKVSQSRCWIARRDKNRDRASASRISREEERREKKIVRPLATKKETKKRTVQRGAGAERRGQCQPKGGRPRDSHAKKRPRGGTTPAREEASNSARVKTRGWEIEAAIWPKDTATTTTSGAKEADIGGDNKGEQQQPRVPSSSRPPSLGGTCMPVANSCAKHQPDRKQPQMSAPGMGATGNETDSTS